MATSDPSHVPTGSELAVANYQQRLITMCQHNDIDLPTYDIRRECDKNCVNQWECDCFLTLPAKFDINELGINNPLRVHTTDLKKKIAQAKAAYEMYNQLDLILKKQKSKNQNDTEFQIKKFETHFDSLSNNREYHKTICDCLSDYMKHIGKTKYKFKKQIEMKLYDILLLTCAEIDNNFGTMNQQMYEASQYYQLLILFIKIIYQNMDLHDIHVLFQQNERSNDMKDTTKNDIHFIEIKNETDLTNLTENIKDSNDNACHLLMNNVFIVWNNDLKNENGHGSIESANDDSKSLSLECNNNDVTENKENKDNNSMIANMIDINNKKELSMKLKLEGNEYFAEKEFKNALDKYTKAIELDSDNCLLFMNRCLCYIRMSQNCIVNDSNDDEKTNDSRNEKQSLLVKALEDANHSIFLQSNLPKAHLRKAMVLFEMKNYRQALYAVRKAKAKILEMRQKQKQQGNKHLWEQMNQFENKIMAYLTPPTNGTANNDH